MDSSQLTQVLLNCTTPDPNIRQMAEKWLQEAEKANIALFLQMLSHELSNNDKPSESRKLAGLIIKNSLTAKDENRKMQLVQKWINLDINIRTTVKTAVLMTLSAANRDARSTAAQVVAAIAHIELPRHLWADLIQVLLSNMQQENDHLKQATLEAIGYICEEIEAEVLTAQANSILTAVCKGMKENNNDVKLAACNALYNCLEFVRANFEKDVERHYIMQVTCETAACTDLAVRVASFECLVKIASLYYDKLGTYMQRLFNLTLEAIKKDTDEVALQSVEFWSTICDEELYLLEEAEEAAELKIQPSRQSQNFIRGALKFLVPILTECLLKQEDEPDEDTWNVAMAAGTCLALVATVVGDDVVQFVVPFVQQHIAATNWKSREAATLAFGAILEGPKSFVPQLVAQALPVLIQHMKDPIVYVKDTTAWTIGRICQLHPQTVSPYLQNLITVLVEALSDSARVAANACWAIHNLALAYEDDQEKQTSVLSQYFQVLLEKLLSCTVRDDSDESNLRTSAYEAINVLIQSGAQDTHQVIMNATPVFIERLEKTFAMPIVSQDDKEEQNELQSLLCGVIQVIIQKMGENIKTFADKMMALFLQVFSVKSASVHEEALMAVGALANAVESDFEKYMAHFRPYLNMGLKNYEEHQVCAVAVGVVGDISRALLNKMVPYCDEIVSLLLQDLQNPLLNRSVKPPILSCFGDIALAIGGEFVKYLGVVMSMLQQASSTTVDTNDFDLVDYLNQLREAIFEAYTGIIQGLRGDNAGDHFLPFVVHVVSFVGFVFQDKSRSDAVTRGALGVLGDLAHALGSKVKQQLQQPFVKQLITQCLQSDSSQTREVAQWAKEVLSKL